MKILAIETATDACSAALQVDQECTVEYQLAPRQHTQLILPMVDSLLARAQLSLQQLDAIAFGCGPGAFTGLRIAAGVTQGLGLAADLPVIPVSTLAAMAQQAGLHYQSTAVLAALDARIGEVYWGRYQLIDGRASLQGEEQVIRPDQLKALPENSWVAVGSGWDVYGDTLRGKVKGELAHLDAQLTPSAEFIAQLAAFEYQAGHVLPVEAAQPVYLRNKVADTIREREARKRNDEKGTG